MVCIQNISLAFENLITPSQSYMYMHKVLNFNPSFALYFFSPGKLQKNHEVDYPRSSLIHSYYHYKLFSGWGLTRTTWEASFICFRTGTHAKKKKKETCPVPSSTFAALYPCSLAQTLTSLPHEGCSAKVHSLFFLLHEFIFLLFRFLHSFYPGLVAPSKQGRCVDVRVGVIFIVTDLTKKTV